MKDPAIKSKSPDYGIDGPIVLRNLALIEIGAIALGLAAYHELLPMPRNIAFIFVYASAGIVIFNLICITLSILSSKVGMRKFSSRIILSVFTVFITIFSAAEGLAENKLEEAKKIELLLAGIGTMENVVFIRNGKEYSANKGGGL